MASQSPGRCSIHSATPTRFLTRLLTGKAKPPPWCSHSQTRNAEGLCWSLVFGAHGSCLLWSGLGNVEAVGDLWLHSPSSQTLCVNSANPFDGRVSLRTDCRLLGGSLQVHPSSSPAGSVPQEADFWLRETGLRALQLQAGLRHRRGSREIQREKEKRRGSGSLSARSALPVAGGGTYLCPRRLRLRMLRAEGRDRPAALSPGYFIQTGSYTA